MKQFQLSLRNYIASGDVTELIQYAYHHHIFQTILEDNLRNLSANNITTEQQLVVPFYLMPCSQ